VVVVAEVEEEVAETTLIVLEAHAAKRATLTNLA